MTADPQPTVSMTSEDGTIIEMVYDRAARTTAFAIGRMDGSADIAPHFDLPDGTRLVPYSPNNNLLTSGCVLLPSGMGDVGDDGDLLNDIAAYLRRYVDLSPGFMEIASYYVLLTWVYDAFRELGYLRFRGDFGCGKTRALITVGSICNKPFFASGASTISPIFHILDRFRGTMLLDEADFRFSDMTGELTKVLNNGTVDGLPVLRTMANRYRELNPQAFRVYGPKLVAMRERFSDDALESRFFTEEMTRRPLPQHVPIHTPDALAEDALGLRNRLLAWRLANLRSIVPDRGACIEGASPRLNQTALALLSLVRDPAARARISGYFVDMHNLSHKAQLATPDMLVLAALVNAFTANAGPVIPIADVARRYNSKASLDALPPMTNKWVGTMVRTKLGIATAKSHGTYGIPMSERSRVRALAERYGVPHTLPTNDMLFPHAPE